METSQDNGREENIVSREEVKKRLRELLLNRDEPLCIVIRGEWGVGKTHLWKEFTRENLESCMPFKKKHYAYISLFGKHSIDDVRIDLTLQLSKFRKVAHTLGKVLKATEPVSSHAGSIGSLLSLLIDKDFKNVIVCFDEFERMSPNLEIKEVLGFISYLKENLLCKVIIILDEDKLLKDKNFREIYTEYKEKIIDFEIRFNPPYDENLRIVLDIYKNNIPKISKNIIQDFVSSIKVKNIRILKRILNVLSDFTFVESIDGINEDFKLDFYKKLILLSYLAYKYGYTENLCDVLNKIFDEEFTKLLTRSEEEEENKKDPKEISEIKKIISAPILYQRGLLYIDDDVKNICSYLKYGLITEDIKNKIHETFQTKQKHYEAVSLIQELDKLIYELKYSLTKSVDKVINEIIELIKKKSILDYIKLAGESTFNFINKILFVRRFANDEQVQTLDKIIQEYFKEYLYAIPNDKFLKIIYDDWNIKIFLQNLPYKDLREKLEDIYSQVVENKRQELYKELTCEKIKEIIKRIITPTTRGGIISYGWSHEDKDILNNIDMEFLRKCIYNDSEFLDFSIKLFMFKNYFESFVQKLSQIIKEDKNIDNRRKRYLLELLK